MLTHLHMLVHTWWCWHTLRRRWSLKGREGFVFFSPSRRACEAGFSAFEKMKPIFSITLVESLEKSQMCFSLEKHSPDAGPVSGVLLVFDMRGKCVLDSPTSERRTWPAYGSRIRQSMTSAGTQARVSAGVHVGRWLRPMANRRTRQTTTRISRTL